MAATQTAPAPHVVRSPRLIEPDHRQQMRLVEQETTRLFRWLVDLVGFQEANRRFDLAGLNDDGPTWPGKDEAARDLVDQIARRLMEEKR